MRKDDLPTVWSAPPHTLAKIKILHGYLQAYFPILGMRFHDQPLLYIDGFAGPGQYRNAPNGSPIAAYEAAKEAFLRYRDQWVAGTIHLAFIEHDPQRFAILRERVESLPKIAAVRTHLYNTTFVDGLERVKQELPMPFQSNAPLFAFIDPFGVTGPSFSTVFDLLETSTSEILINLSAQGIRRIFQAGGPSNELNLDDVFGDRSWRGVLHKDQGLQQLGTEALALYKARLRSIPGVRYLYSFEMRTRTDSLTYYLVFAGKHPLGLTKMKEAMQRISQTREYIFSDANVDQIVLVDVDDDFYDALLFAKFRGQRALPKDLLEYTLNETRYTLPTEILTRLERRGAITNVQYTSPRKVGQFNLEKLISVTFAQEIPPEKPKTPSLDLFD